MANNFTVKDGNNANVTFASTESGGVQYPINYVAQYGSSAFYVSPIYVLASACTPASHISLATTNSTVVKSSAGVLGHIVATNNHATNIAYLKLYDKATAPTVGTDVPLQVYALAPGAGGISISFPVGLVFNSGISFAITGGILNNDTTAVAASQVAVSLGYR